MSISSLDIHPKLISTLTKARITDVSKLLSYSHFELEKKTGLSEAEIHELLKFAAKQNITPNCYALASEIHQRSQNAAEFLHFKLKTGCKNIDQILSGGFLYPGITEIAGQSACGKTQLCMQLCINVQSGGKNTDKEGAIYVCTEDVFPTKRLLQMSAAYLKKIGNFSSKVSEITDHIFIEHAADLDDLLVLLTVRLPSLLQRHQIKLIVIDSIAALFRVEYDSWQMAERAKMLAKVGSVLHKMSHQNKLCVVCINQVSAVFSDVSNSDKVIPALGLTWSYYVTTRIMLTRTEYTLSMFSKQLSDTEFDPVVRLFKVMFAPHLPVSSCHFIVNRDGVQDFNLPNSY